MRPSPTPMRPAVPAVVPPRHVSAALATAILAAVAVVSPGHAQPGTPTKPVQAPEGRKSAQKRLDPRALAATLEKARSLGHRMLLRQIEVPADRARFGDFHEHGPLAARSYAGHRDLPWGYWIYVAPYWFIFRDEERFTGRRAHGPETVTGAPDVSGAGDNQSSWAQRSEDTGAEWLMCEYDRPIEAVEIRVHETFRPGAITKVTIFRLDGSEVTVMENAKPGPVAEQIRMLKIPLPLGFAVSRLKIYLDTKSVHSFNEIDAVGLLDKKAKLHWATAAHVSSFYGGAPRTAPAQLGRRGPTPPLDLRLDRLDKDMRELKQSVAELRRLVEALVKAQKRRG